METDIKGIICEHIASLEDQLSVLHAEMIPLIREIEKSVNALAVLGVKLECSSLFQQLRSMPAPGPKGISRSNIKFPLQRMTIKQLCYLALETVFHDGATAVDLLAYFADHWDRPDVIRSSISPQLSRLKADGKIIFENGIWKIDK